MDGGYVWLLTTPISYSTCPGRRKAPKYPFLSSRKSEISYFFLSILCGARNPSASRCLPGWGSADSSLGKSRAEKGTYPGCISKGVKGEEAFLERRWLLEAAHTPLLGVIAGDILG